tara:strand:+ start:69 stop:293 length:225 start_codon:yes stop_codon:yes gene_type:complete
MSKDKFGPYINSLMATVVDKEAAEFIKELAHEELTRLNVNMDEFLKKYSTDESEDIEKTEKQLLQEQENSKEKK